MMDPQQDTPRDVGRVPAQTQSTHSEEIELAEQRTYEPNALLRWLYSRFFSHIEVDDRWSEEVGKAAARGTVLYVMRSLSVLDFLCVDYLTKRFGLPLIRFVNDLGLWILEPFGKGGRRLRLRRQIPESHALTTTVEAGHSALLFLRGRPRFGTTSHHGEPVPNELMPWLIAAQRRTDRPILLVPQTFVWGKLPTSRMRGLWDWLLGPSEWPGRLRTLFRFVLNYRDAQLRTGEPFDLKDFIDAHPGLTDRQISEKVLYALLRRMERERTLVLGPSKKTPWRLREEISRSPRLTKHIKTNARSTNRSEDTVRREVDRELKKLMATPGPRTLTILHRILDRVWHKIYDGIEVDSDGLARVREAARKGPLVLIPSHKSHVDYLVLSDVFFARSMSPPLIAAGDNLNFWPLGNVLRRGGAFFIRRSFSGQRLYSAIVDAYIRKVLNEGHHVEFFIEGGRSRSGKLLPPKYGLLSMLVDACMALPSRRVTFVPISISYELIVEQQSYVNELTGGDKQQEDISGLLRAPEVLRSRYGRLYIDFGELLSFDDMLQEHAEGDERELNAPQRRALVQRIAHRTVHEINQATVVTPVALVALCLMAHRRRGLSRHELGELAQEILDSLKSRGARMHGPIADGPVRSQQAISEALSLLLDGKLVQAHDPGEDTIYSVPEERRIALEYYKNNILHYFVSSSLIAAALVAEGDPPARESVLRERVQELSRLFKFEFMFRADTGFDEIFDEELVHMVDRGELHRADGKVRKSSGPHGARVDVYAGFLHTYLEAYRLACRVLLDMHETSMTKKEFIKRGLTLGQRMYLAGEIDHRESVARPKLENALKALTDYGLAELGRDGSVRQGPGFQEAGVLETFERNLRHYLS